MLVGPIVSPGCIMPKIGLAVNGIRIDRESHHATTIVIPVVGET